MGEGAPKTWCSKRWKEEEGYSQCDETMKTSDVYIIHVMHLVKNLTQGCDVSKDMKQNYVVANIVGTKKIGDVYMVHL